LLLDNIAKEREDYERVKRPIKEYPERYWNLTEPYSSSQARLIGYNTLKGATGARAT
jgi:hypothetical protein